MKKTIKNILLLTFSVSIVLGGCNQSLVDKTSSMAKTDNVLSSVVSSTNGTPYSIYTNDKLGYNFEYPNQFTEIIELEDKTGINLSDKQGNEIRVVAHNNINEKGTQFYLDDIKSKAVDVMESYIDDYSFEISYKGTYDDRSSEYTYFECGYIKNDLIIKLFFKYDSQFPEEFKNQWKYMSEKMVELNPTSK